MDIQDLRVFMSLSLAFTVGIVLAYGRSQEVGRANYEIDQLRRFEKLSNEKVEVKPRQNAWGGLVEVSRAGAGSGSDLVYAGVPTKGCVRLGYSGLENGAMALAVNGVDIPVGGKNEKLDADVERLLAACDMSESNNTLTFSKSK